jgi:hypothetical protein
MPARSTVTSLDGRSRPPGVRMFGRPVPAVLLCRVARSQRARARGMPAGLPRNLDGRNPMSPVKSLWAMVQGDPVFMRRINGWLTILWVAMIPVSLATGWVTSVTYVSALSLWALVSGHWSAWQAARVEVHQDDDADVADVLEVVRELRAELAELRLAQ